MGYYSDVAIGMKKNEAVKFLSEGAKVEGEGFLFEDFQLIMRDEYAIIRWPDIKWYDDFEDVIWVMEYLNKLSEEGKPVGFVRVGEDSNDSEDWYSNDKDYSLCRCFWLKRSIEFAA